MNWLVMILLPFGVSQKLLNSLFAVGMYDHPFQQFRNRSYNMRTSNALFCDIEHLSCGTKDDFCFQPGLIEELSCFLNLFDAIISHIIYHSPKQGYIGCTSHGSHKTLLGAPHCGHIHRDSLPAFQNMNDLKIIQFAVWAVNSYLYNDITPPVEK